MVVDYVIYEVIDINWETLHFFCIKIEYFIKLFNNIETSHDNQKPFFFHCAILHFTTKTVKNKFRFKSFFLNKLRKIMKKNKFLHGCESQN